MLTSISCDDAGECPKCHAEAQTYWIEDRIARTEHWDLHCHQCGYYINEDTNIDTGKTVTTDGFLKDQYAQEYDTEQ